LKNQVPCFFQIENKIIIFDKPYFLCYYIVNQIIRTKEWGTPPKGCTLFVRKNRFIRNLRRGFMKFNGKDLTLENPTPLTNFLEENGYKLSHIAIELNEEIIPRANFGTIVLKNDDVLEVVTFMGGGK
jgi:sulfur carrier protein